MPFRADYNDPYYFVRANLEVHQDLERGCAEDRKRYEAGNYFETLQQAELAADVLHDVFSEIQKRIPR